MRSQLYLSIDRFMYTYYVYGIVTFYNVAFLSALSVPANNHTQQFRAIF